ncbi:branched-chain amino acid ABC transporter permease [Granulosicoccus sp. 3-233]|uniref:branched-chain amino acid ABC transporter permease n=1 Tax=Granulosicoccus sp. 3-233 TaxID=3417969 RepID=UPI003D358556
MIGIISYLAFFLTIALIMAIAVLGLNLQWGYTGLFNGGIVAFFGAGAYGIILLGGPDRIDGLGGFSLPYPVALLGGIALAGLLALLVGLATTRLRHDYLAIATFGVAIAMESLMRNASWLTGGATGLRGFERPFEALVGNSFAYNLLFLFFVVLCVSLVFLFLEILVRSPFGRLLRAVRENERAARSLGKSPSAVRLTAFIIGAMIMGLSGALYATFYAFISPQDLAPILTFQIWAMLIVGGSGNNAGAVLGTLVVWGAWVGSGWLLTAIVPTHLQLYTGSIQYILVGSIIVFSLLWRPRGLLPEKLSVHPYPPANPDAAAQSSASSRSPSHPAENTQ